jgi:hypothetical protein
METSVNNKCKAFTSLEQAKELLKILPHQSADMSFNVEKGYEVILHPYMTSPWIGVPCWSLAALLGVLPDYTLQTTTDKKVFVTSDSKKPMMSDTYDNSVDACVAMIEKLNELNLL